MVEILIYCEKDETAFEIVSQAKRLKDNLHADIAALVLNGKDEGRIGQYFSYGADKLYIPEPIIPPDADVDACTNAIAEVMTKYPVDILLMGSTKAGKQIAPMVAQKIGAGCVTDAIGIKLADGELAIDRYSLGGNTVSTQVIKTPKKVVAVMPKTFQLGEKTDRRGDIVNVALGSVPAKLKVVEKQPKTGESAPIEEAETLVCVGRGLAEKKDMPIIEALAAALKAEIGATRPLTHDWQWFHESREVGLSGKKCKPRLCVSIGISGQIQHTVGIRSSKIIVAINKDKAAPIFKIADYGIVADLYEVIPRLTQRVLNSSTKH